MDLETRKLEFIQEFLKLHNEDAISRLEQILNEEIGRAISPMSVNEFNSRIDKSETDLENNEFKTNDDLILKYK